MKLGKKREPGAPTTGGGYVAIVPFEDVDGLGYEPGDEYSGPSSSYLLERRAIEGSVSAGAEPARAPWTPTGTEPPVDGGDHETDI